MNTAVSSLPQQAAAPTLRPWLARVGAAVWASLEAQKVRDLAYSYSRTDPGFAADLYAAAARHEGLYAD